MKWAAVFVVSSVFWISTGALAQSRYEATVSIAEYRFGSQSEKQLAVLKAANVDDLVEQILTVIRPAKPSLQPDEIPLGKVTLDKFQQTLAFHNAGSDLVELRIRQSVQGTPGTAGKTDARSNTERKPAKWNQLEAGKRYEVKISKTDYVTEWSQFEIRKESGKVQLEFADRKLVLEPAGAGTVRFTIDTTALPENSRQNVRNTIGQKVETRHHMLRLVEAPSGNPLWGITPAEVNAANVSVNANPGVSVNANAGDKTELVPIQFYVIKVKQ